MAKIGANLPQEYKYDFRHQLFLFTHQKVCVRNSTELDSHLPAVTPLHLIRRRKPVAVVLWKAPQRQVRRQSHRVTHMADCGQARKRNLGNATRKNSSATPVRTPVAGRTSITPAPRTITSWKAMSACPCGVKAARSDMKSGMNTSGTIQPPSAARTRMRIVPNPETWVSV